MPSKATHTHAHTSSSTCQYTVHRNLILQEDNLILPDTPHTWHIDDLRAKGETAMLSDTFYLWQVAM